MNPNFNLCDVCGERVKESDRFFAAAGYTHNGIENVNEGKHIDLCSKHLVALVLHLIAKCYGKIESYEVGKRVIAFVETQKRKQ